ncbi:hypothetical protein ACH4RG_22990 [Streptomyces sp. NPDC021019]|uniref:hypothetical protein n=1 Tax=Streptomyces sp. NPDC021019 TaxID=3365108 RepID=UPI0037A4C1F8
MALRPEAIHDLTSQVLGCVCAALVDASAQIPGQPGCPCRACVIPGLAAWDSCEDPCGTPAGQDSGQLTVSVARIYSATLESFPAEARTVFGVKGCTPPPFTAVELVITLLRCAPTPNDDGCPPSCEDLEAAARRLHVDMVTVYNALLCCLPGTDPVRPRGRRFLLGQQKVLGPEGGCVGLEQRATVALAGCGCPEEVAP